MLIRLKNIRKSYKMGDEIIPILNGIDLEISTGDYVAIMGSSGSGKSTLMHILGCLDNDYEGEYALNGQAVHGLDSARLAEARRRQIGFIFQTFHLIGKLSARENVTLPLLYARTPDRGQAEALLRKVGLSHRLDHFPNQLSGGERQRVAIARALVNNPKILMADEPTGNLDSASGKAVMDIMDGLNREGKTLIIVTHDLGVAAHARTVIRFKDGQIDREEHR